MSDSFESFRDDTYFIKMVLPSTTAATRVFGLPNEQVAIGGRRPYLITWRAALDGATSWSGGTCSEVYIEQTGLGADRFVTIPIAALTSGNLINDSTPGVQLESIYYLCSGGVASLGVSLVGDANAGAGSDLIVTAHIRVAITP